MSIILEMLLQFSISTLNKKILVSENIFQNISTIKIFYINSTIFALYLNNYTKKKMQVKLQDIAQIQFGYYAQPSNKGTIPYLQAKHFNEYGQLVNGNDTFLEEDERANQNILIDGNANIF